MQKLQLQGHSLDTTEIVKSVRAHVAVKCFATDLGLHRMTNATEIAARIRFAPLPVDIGFKLKGSPLLECMVAPVSG